MSASPLPATGFLVHPLLGALGVAHGFGLRESPEVPRLLQPRQVHGRDVLRVGPGPAVSLGEGDAVVSTAPHQPVAVVTADCLPVLLAAGRGEAVAAVHAGWRGLARGVVGAALRVLRESCASEVPIRAVLGPHIGVCCYEIDEPVMAELRKRFGAELEKSVQPTRQGHARLDLARLARAELEAAGVEPEQVGQLEAVCTRCDARRFHSYRRDGDAAGRLVHWIMART